MQKFEFNDPSKLGQILGGNFSSGIDAPSSPSNLAEQIKTIALNLMAQSGNSTPFDMRQQRDGALEFIIGGRSYASVEEIPHVNVKSVIQQAVAEWQKEN